MKKLILLAFLITPNFANADIYDRIDRCESNPGWSCLFDILRELASDRTNHSNNLVIKAGEFSCTSSETFEIMHVTDSQFTTVVGGNGSTTYFQCEDRTNCINNYNVKVKILNPFTFHFVGTTVTCSLVD